MTDKARAAILISGRGSNMAALIYAARADDCPFKIVLVTGDRPDAPGLALAEAEGVRILKLDAKATNVNLDTKAENVKLDAKANKAGQNNSIYYWRSLQSALDEARVEVVALAGFMRIIPADFVARWAGRMINIHPSLLPAHPGLGVHDAVLEAGERVTGATVHLVSEQVDSGSILGQVEVAVLPGDTADTLATRVLIAEHQLYPRVLALFVTRERDPEFIVARVGGLALSLPETRFKTSHGAPGWKVGSPSSDKFFAIMWMKHHGEDSVAVLVKTSGQEEMAQLIEAEPEFYFRPQYYGPSDWIGLRLDRAGVDWDHVAAWLQRSWQSCAPPRLTKLMNIAEEF